MIAIVDYGMGNLRSVEKGFKKVGIEAEVTSSARKIDDASAVVLPGVGAFRDCIKNLTDLSLTGAIAKAIQKGKPYLGICLGLQVLFSESEEFGRCTGLDILRGKVVRFRIREKVPHMGWNTVNVVRRPPIFSDIPDNAYFYFVHSFYVVPDDEGVVAGTTDYGLSFTSMIWKDNVFATQFHPEKSQEMGLKVLAGFGQFVKKS
ncbi:MAG: imidazole glycerol phosphate synthase subunit HisH [Nitrospiraceae bacterium]|nr:imidazole glycerol phosphate synthase subunit HisH [Nitrospiraceae bacterium]